MQINEYFFSYGFIRRSEEEKNVPSVIIRCPPSHAAYKIGFYTPAPLMLGRVIEATGNSSRTRRRGDFSTSPFSYFAANSSDHQQQRKENDKNDGDQQPSVEEVKQRAKLGMVVDMAETSWVGGLIPTIETPRFPYSRPEFMFLISDDEIHVSGDQSTRPVLVPKDPSQMPLYAGYAESINAGKTKQNEDQGSAKILHLLQASSTEYSSRKTAGTETPLVGRKLSRRKRADSDCQMPESEKANEETEEYGQKRRLSDDDFLLHLNSLSVNNGKKEEPDRVEAQFFGVFDGHAGTGAALMAGNCLHEHVRERLSQVLDTILHLDRQEQLVGYLSGAPAVSTPSGKTLTRDSLVVGALETAFVEMDEQISEEKLLWRIPGGCASLVALFLLGKVYVANAGDCRCLLVCKDRIEQLSQDFTPDAERKRLQFLAFRQPELIGKHFTRLEYSRHLFRKDVRKKVLYRDWYMDGWAQKTVRDADIRPPLISDCLKKCRLLNTIGVTRGFGDHHLMTLDDHIPIKPFLTPVPEVRVFDMTTLDSLTEMDVLVLASDGLWDVVSNEEAANIVQASLSQAPTGDHTMYTLAAQDLVIAARGDRDPSGRWQFGGGKSGHASTDDITVFVIPLKYALAPPQKDDDDELLQ